MENHNIEINISEAYRYMGGSGTPDGETMAELRQAARLIKEQLLPHVVIKVCELDKNGGVNLKGTNLSLQGKSISALLNDCDYCQIFCATIGSDIDALIRQWQHRDVTFAAMLDACGSSAVESLCDNVETELRDECASQGLFITDRFSPGYGDLPLAIQPAFCAALDTARRIGVVVNENCMMIPQKSVTAIIGISKSPQRHHDIGCRDCGQIKSCKFRENGVTCYGRAL